MATCNNITQISQSEFLAESLFKLNTNYFNLDFGLCKLGQDLLTLDAFVKSLSAKDSPTVDMSFSSAGYFLSADVKDNSIATAKLGVDIPTTTKTFLTAAKISSLIDTSVINVNRENVLRWSGSTWVNTSLVDEIGAIRLPDLKDVRVFEQLLVDGDVLKYNTALSAWVSTPEFGLSALPDGDYEDITVSGGGQVWNIKPGRVAEIELNDNAVTTRSISGLQITNSKFTDTDFLKIQKIKFADNLGEINTAVNLSGDGARVCLETSQDTKIPFRRIRGALGCSVTGNNTGITIRANPPPSIPIPVGNNLGNSSATNFTILQGITQGTNIFQLKSLKAGTNIIIQEQNDNNEIIISRPINLGLTVIGINPDGTPMTNAQIASRVAAVFPPENFETNTICNVQVEIPGATSFPNLPVNIPFTTRYLWRSTSATKCIGPCTTTYNMIFEWLDVNIAEGINQTGWWKDKGTDVWTGERDLNTIVNVGTVEQVKFTATSENKRFIKSGNTWIISP